MNCKVIAFVLVVLFHFNLKLSSLMWVYLHLDDSNRRKDTGISAFSPAGSSLNMWPCLRSAYTYRREPALLCEHMSKSEGVSS